MKKPASTSGYSKTLLYKKLGIKEGFHLILHNQPDYYFDLFEELPGNLTIDRKVKESITPIVRKAADFIHIFCTNLNDLEEASTKLLPTLKQTGMVWISWPKGSSKIPSEIKREPVRDYMLTTGLVDIKVAAIDEDWSGLKFVYRLKDRI